MFELLELIMSGRLHYDRQFGTQMSTTNSNTLKKSEESFKKIYVFLSKCCFLARSGLARISEKLQMYSNVSKIMLTKN